MSELLPACVEPDRFLVELAFEETSNVPPEIQAHIAGCDRCSRELRALREARSLAALPLEEPSAEVDRNIFAALDAHLAGDKVDTFIKLPEPERALGAERLVRHLSMPPRPRAAEAQVAVEPRERTLPRPVRSRRRWTTGLAAAASVTLVAGGALYLNQNAESSIASRPAAEAAADQDRAFRDTVDGKMAKQEAAKDAPAEAPKERFAQLDEGAAKPDSAAPMAADKAKRGPAAEAKNLRTFGDSNDARRADSLQQLIQPPAPQGLHASGDVAGGRYDSGLPRGGAAGVGSLAGEKRDYREKTAKKVAVAEPPSADAQSRAPAAAPPPPAAAPAMPMAAADEAPARQKMKRESRADETVAKGMAADAESDKLEQPAWSAALTRARAAAGRRDHNAAAQAFAEVLATGGAPSNVEQEALKGRLDALLALHRFNEAQAVADTLASRFPAQASARARVQQAKSDAEPAKAAPVDAAPATPVEAERPAAVPTTGK